MSFFSDIGKFFTSTPVRIIGGGLGAASSLGAFDDMGPLFGSTSKFMDPRTLIGGLNAASGVSGLANGQGGTLLNLAQLGLGGYNAAQGFGKAGPLLNLFGNSDAAGTTQTGNALANRNVTVEQLPGSVGNGGVAVPDTGASTMPATGSGSNAPVPSFGQLNDPGTSGFGKSTDSFTLKPTGAMPPVQSFEMGTTGGQANNLTVGEFTPPVTPTGTPGGTFDNMPNHPPQYGPESVPDPRMTPAAARTSVGDFTAARNSTGALPNTGADTTKLPNVTGQAAPFDPVASQSANVSPTNTGTKDWKMLDTSGKAIVDGVGKAGDKVWSMIEKDPMKATMAGTMLLSAFSESPQEKAAKVYAEKMAEYEKRLDPNSTGAQSFRASYTQYRTQQLDLAQQKAVADYEANAVQRGIPRDSTVWTQGMQSINAEYDRLKSQLNYDSQMAWLQMQQGTFQPLATMSQTAAQAGSVAGAGQPQFNSTTAYLLAK